MYYLTKVAEGGHTRVEIGIRSGILFIVINSCDSISFTLIRSEGSVLSKLLMKSFACSDIDTVSGN